MEESEENKSTYLSNFPEKQFEQLELGSEVIDFKRTLKKMGFRSDSLLDSTHFLREMDSVEIFFNNVARINYFKVFMRGNQRDKAILDVLEKHSTEHSSTGNFRVFNCRSGSQMFKVTTFSQEGFFRLTYTKGRN